MGLFDWLFFAFALGLKGGLYGALLWTNFIAPSEYWPGVALGVLAGLCLNVTFFGPLRLKVSTEQAGNG